VTRTEAHRSEYSAGEIFAMAGASDRHVTNGVALKQLRDRRRMGLSHAF
jgi:hypothetical protein